MMEPKLTPKQALFVQEYLVDLNGHQAAIRAGYAPKNARITAYQNLTKPYISKAIDAAKLKRLKKIETKADSILIQLDGMRTSDLVDVMQEDGAFLPIREWPLIWRQMLVSMDVREEWVDVDGEARLVGRVVKAKFMDRCRIIELEGRHRDVNIFIETKEVVILDERAKALRDGRKRVLEMQQAENGTYQHVNTD